MLLCNAVVLPIALYAATYVFARGNGDRSRLAPARDSIAKCLASLGCGLILPTKNMMFLAFMNLGGQELILILLLVLVLFGAKKLPELARGMGQAIKEFQKAKDEFSDELHSASKTDVAAKPAASTVPTVPRIENATADGAVRTEASKTVEPGSQA